MVRSRFPVRSRVVASKSNTPVAQLDQSAWLRTRRSGVRVSPGVLELVIRKNGGVTNFVRMWTTWHERKPLDIAAQ